MFARAETRKVLERGTSFRNKVSRVLRTRLDEAAAAASGGMTLVGAISVEYFCIRIDVATPH
jgi:hypothetical protein